MKLEIEHAGARTEVQLRDGIFTFGGALTDAVHLPGMPASQLAAQIDGAMVVVEAGEPLAVDGVLTPPKVRRLWMPGEAITLGDGVWVKRLEEGPAQRKEGTVALVQGLFDSDDQAVLTEGPRVVCLTGLDLGRIFPVADGVTEVGRGVKIGLRIRDRSVSRRHARLVRQDGQTFIEDLGSPNGTYVRGRRVKSSRRLSDGDVIEVGTALLKFRCPAPEPVAQVVVTDSGSEEAPPLPASEDGAENAAPERQVLIGALVLAIIGALATWQLTA